MKPNSFDIRGYATCKDSAAVFDEVGSRLHGPKREETFSQQLAHFRFRIGQIAERDGPFGHFHTRGQLVFSQTFRTELAFFHHALGPRGKIKINTGQMRPGVLKVTVFF